MNRKTKVLTIVIIINILMSIILSLYQYKSFAAATVKQTISADINAIDEEKYPGIKQMIKDLQAKHPKWNFKILYTGLKWEDVIEGEEKHGKNVIGKGQKNYSGDWICSTCNKNKKTYEGGGWVCVAPAAIEYMMDPRNSLYDADVFQFLELSYDKNIKYDKDVLKEILEGTFLDDGKLDTYVETILTESRRYGINPYYVTVKAIQEQGINGGSTFKIRDTSVKDKIVYYYNIFNINATGGSTSDIVKKALLYAKKKELNTIEKCIKDGIEFIVDSYISSGQNTMYFEKFDVIGPVYYSHQYATDVMYAQNQGTRLRIDLEKIDAKEYGYTFVIPLYENMPKTACKRPSTENQTSTIITKNGISIDNKNKTIITTEGTTIKNILNVLESKDEAKNKKGKKCKETDNAGTGYTIGKYKIIILGDSNGDAKVNSGDLFTTQKYLLTKSKLTNEISDAMDVNGDSKINSGDLFNLQKYLLGNNVFEIK